MKVVETKLALGNLSARKSTRRIIIHHSASEDVPATEIHRWHLRRGWAGIGYHYVIRADGTIERGRPEDTIGAHAEGANSDSIGVCLTGNFDEQPPTAPQLQSLVALARDLRRRHGDIPVIGHSDVQATACPGRRFPWLHLRHLLGPPLPAIQDRVPLVVKGKPVDVEAYLIDSQTYVPLRFVGETLGHRIAWRDGIAYVD